jgi:hypothetical protein
VIYIRLLRRRKIKKRRAARRKETKNKKRRETTEREEKERKRNEKEKRRRCSFYLSSGNDSVHTFQCLIIDELIQHQTSSLIQNLHVKKQSNGHII